MKSIANEILDYFEKSIPNYYNTEDIRSTQVQMALHIADFLFYRREKILILEAPVGTGKSLGALVPIMFYANKKFNNALYATATINLQGQLMNSEIPILDTLDLISSPLLAKGKSHYYCHREYNFYKKSLEKKYGEAFTSFFSNTDTGHRNDFEDNYVLIDDKEWEKVSLKATKGECSRCDLSTACPSFQHRRQFLSTDNDLVITNHNQLIRSVSLKLDDPFNAPIVPVNPGVIIIDEAHHFQENFLGEIERKFSIKQLRSFKNKFRGEKRKKYEHYISKIENAIKEKGTELDSTNGRYPIPKYIYRLFLPIRSMLNELIESLIVSQMESKFGSEKDSDVSNVLDEITQTIPLLDSEDYVSWMNYEDHSFSTITTRFPIDYRDMLSYMMNNNKVIVMSGTLTQNGDFQSLLNQWRLNSSDVVTCSIDTSFDYKNQATIYVPEVLPKPKEKSTIPDKYWMEQINHIKELLELTFGRTLILTTAKDDIDSIYSGLSSFTKEKNITLLKQDMGGVEQLTKQFKEDETSVLIGSGSFYSGFSVSGNALNSVILNKLPFPVPDDPYLKLIGQGYEDDYFNTILLPNMLVKFNQAVGRLIRDIQDFGIVTILDPRIYNSDYSKVVQSELTSKGYRITRNINEVRTFLENHRCGLGKSTYPVYRREDLTISPKLLEEPQKVKRINFEKDLTIKNTKVKKTRVAVNNEERKKRVLDKISDIQKSFAQEIYIQRNKLYPKGIKSAKNLYENLYNLFYLEGEPTNFIRDNFPYKDDTQKKLFSSFQGSGSRKYKLPKCLEFGCSGSCNKDNQLKVEKEIEEFNGGEYKLIPCKGHCLVNFDDLTVIDRLHTIHV